MGIKKTEKKDKTSNSKKAEETAKQVAKVKSKLVNDDIVYVKNNTAGTLLYINHNSGEEFIWNEHGEVMELTIADLKQMKSKQRRFFEDNWVTLESSENEDYSIEEICGILRITQYYNNTGFDFDIEDVIMSKNHNQIKQVCVSLPSGLTGSFVTVANSLIIEGELHDIRKIRAIEETLNVKLTDGSEEDE